MSKLLCFLLAYVGLTVASYYPPLSCADQTAIENLFLEALDTFNYGQDSTPGDLAAKWVRLSFHDSVTWDPASRTGGTHACIAVPCASANQCERTLYANNGLAKVADDLDALWYNNGWSNTLSKADFWSLAGKVAVEWASGGTAQLPWGYGRTDCAQACPLWANRHPDASQGYYALQTHLVNRLGFSWEQAIALLGAHSLGETHVENSGYQGRWVPSPANYLNNNFYRVLLKYDWYSTVVPPYQGGSSSYGSGSGYNSYGNGGSSYNSYGSGNAYNNQKGKVEYVNDGLPGSVMLPSDGAIYYQNLNLSCTLTTHTNCPLYAQHCPFATNFWPIVRRFAADNNYWMQVFLQSYQRLQEFGGDQIYYNPTSDVQYDLYQTHWTGYSGWYTNAKDYGVQY